jgi:hypothetical protein
VTVIIIIIIIIIYALYFNVSGFILLLHFRHYSGKVSAEHIYIYRKNSRVLP